MSLPVATSDTAELLHYALRCGEALYQPGYQFSKADVLLLNLVPDQQIQTHLFDERDRGTVSQTDDGSRSTESSIWFRQSGQSSINPLKISQGSLKSKKLYMVKLTTTDLLGRSQLKQG